MNETLNHEKLKPEPNRGLKFSYNNNNIFTLYSILYDNEQQILFPKRY